MPTWILIMSAIAGFLLITGEFVIRLVVSLRRPDPAAVDPRLDDALHKLADVDQAATGVSAAREATPPSDEQVQELKDALDRIETTVEGSSRTIDAGGGFLGHFFDGVTKQNLFLGVGIVLLLVPALIAGGFTFGFDTPDTGSSQTTSP